MTPLICLIAVIVVSIFLTIAIEIEWFGWTTLTVLASVAAVQFFHVFDVWLFVKANVFQTVAYVIAYIAIGIIWSFAKWFFFLMNERNKTREWLEGQLKRTDLNLNYNKPVINIPKASDNKGRIVAWISYWPLSLIGTILNDPFRKLFNFIFNQFKGLYQRMANNIYKDDLDKLELTIEELRKKEFEKKYVDTSK